MLKRSQLAPPPIHEDRSFPFVLDLRVQPFAAFEEGASQNNQLIARAIYIDRGHLIDLTLFTSIEHVVQSINDQWYRLRLFP